MEQSTNLALPGHVTDTDVFSVPRDIIQDRESYIVEACRGHCVLHLGCCDYPFTQRAIASKKWLHARIQEVAKGTTGLDMSAEGHEECKKLGHGDNIIVDDACTVQNIPNSPFDAIVAGEIIEHLPNPGVMLTNMRKFLRPGGKLIITTPNAFSLRKQFRVSLGNESVHRDHVMYFSHRTLARLLVMSGYRVVKQANYRVHKNVPWLSRTLEYVASIVNGGLLEGLVVEAEVDPKSDKAMQETPVT